MFRFRGRVIGEDLWWILGETYGRLMGDLEETYGRLMVGLRGRLSGRFWGRLRGRFWVRLSAGFSYTVAYDVINPILILLQILN